MTKGGELLASIRRLTFAEQQELTFPWAANVHLTPEAAGRVIRDLCAVCARPVPEVHWESPVVIENGLLGATYRRARDGAKTLHFPGVGTDLLTLVHELVHVVRPWGDPSHDTDDWDLAVILLEMCVPLGEQLKREAP